MNAVDTHGFKMLGLKRAAGETTNWKEGSGGYTQISYNTKTGEIYTSDHIGLNSWTQYEDKAIVMVSMTDKKMTMQQIADAIAMKMEYIGLPRKPIRLTQKPYAAGGETHCKTVDGKESLHIIRNHFEAHAVDDDEVEYTVYWEIPENYSPAMENESIECNWQYPIYIESCGRDVTDKVELVDEDA